MGGSYRHMILRSKGQTLLLVRRLGTRSKKDKRNRKLENIVMTMTMMMMMTTTTTMITSIEILVISIKKLNTVMITNQRSTEISVKAKTMRMMMMITTRRKNDTAMMMMMTTTMMIITKKKSIRRSTAKRRNIEGETGRPTL